MAPTHTFLIHEEGGTVPRSSGSSSATVEGLEWLREVLGVGVFAMHLPSGVVEWSEGCEAPFGLPAGGFMRRLDDWKRHVHPADMPGFMACFEAPGELHAPPDYRVVWPGGAVRWVHQRGRVSADRQGRPVRLLAVLSDVTECNAVESALRERADFETLIADLSAGFAGLADEDVERQIDQALQRLGEFLNIDRITLWADAGTGRYSALHSWARQGFGTQTGAQVDRDEFPLALGRLEKDSVFNFSRLSDLPASAEAERRYFAGIGAKSLLSIRLRLGASGVGAMSFNAMRGERDWPPETVQRLRLIGEIFTNVLSRRQAAEAMARAMQEISQLKDRLQAENVYLREEVRRTYGYGDIIGKSEAIRRALRQVEQVAGVFSTVLLTGETGTGKELLARAIHNRSSRRDRPMVKVNCAALPATLVESELFGREKGAYTGADRQQIGRFELAHGSTLFLDEVGELPLEIQAKLLRALQEGQFERLGSSKTLTADVRIIAATNRDLAAAVKEGRFREDLYYRLNVFPVHVPALRERKEDIPLLAQAFVAEFSRSMRKTARPVSASTMEALLQYAWPGNIRELRNVIERAMIVSEGAELCVELPQRRGESAPESRDDATLEAMERRHILTALERTGWRVSGPDGAAAQLGLNRGTLQSRMKKLGITRPAVPR